MRQNQFTTYEEYRDAQCALTRRKVVRFKSTRCFCDSEVIQNICSVLMEYESISNRCTTNKIQGVCHGVRHGKELEFWRNSLGGSWQGTEIFPDLCDGINVLNCDFDTVMPQWISELDVVYTNSLDHSRNPEHTTDQWWSCVRPSGFLCVEWTPWHDKLGTGINVADCYAATFGEYLDLLSLLPDSDVRSILVESGDSSSDRHVAIAMKEIPC